jgi:uncharacterized protein (TIGR02145 family)
MKVKVLNSQQSSVHSQQLIIKLLFIILCVQILFINYRGFSQNGLSVNTRGAQADNSAILDVSSTSQGLLITRMTTAERDNIASPATSLLIFNTTTNCFEAYVNGVWFSVSCPPDCSPPDAPVAGTSSASMTQIVWNWSTANRATGYQWNTSNVYPGTGNNVVTNPSYTQTGLGCNTSYTLYVWAFNSCGNSPVITLTQSLTCCETHDCGTVTDIDGNLYNTVLIGSHCWMQENLKTTTYLNGDSIIEVTDNNAWPLLLTGAYSNYKNDINNGNIYGRLYNYYAVNDSRGLCPSGWHVPSHYEWTTLERTVCTSITCNNDFPYDYGTQGYRGTDEAGKLKETGTAHWTGPNTEATNCSGFLLLPGGVRDTAAGPGSFTEINVCTYLWSSDGWYRAMCYFSSMISRFNHNSGRFHGLSVRCVMD